MVRLWVDTDVGTNPDDAVALLVAAGHPGVELVGVSVTGDDRGRRASVVAGLVPPGVSVVGSGGAGEVVEGMVAARPDVLLGIGPLTNVAAALPVLPAGASLTVMGGVVAPVWHRGAWREVETNFGGDPGAAAAVLSWGAAQRAEVTVVPLDATVATGLEADGLGALLEAAPALVAHVEQWREGQPEAAVHLHDPAALLVAVGEGDGVGAVVERAVLTVDGQGRMTAERRGQTGQNLVTSLDGKAVLERVLHILTATR